MLRLSERLYVIDHNLFEMVVFVLDEVIFICDKAANAEIVAADPIAQAERYRIVRGRCSGRGVFGVRCRGLQ